MAYIDVIPLEIAKDYLGVDDTARDAEITRMIKSACIYIERYTNVILVEKEQTYTSSNGCVRVYDYPINTVSDLSTIKSTYTLYDTDSIDLSVGYELATDVPSDLVDAGLQIIKGWFYDSEKRTNTASLPMDAKMILNLYRRFIV